MSTPLPNVSVGRFSSAVPPTVTSPPPIEAGVASRDDLPYVLCVDDDERLLAGLVLRLRRSFSVVTASSATEALSHLRFSRPFAVVISDMRMPNVDGATFLSAMRKVSPETTRLLLTGEADVRSAIAAVNDGEIFRFLQKPVETPFLIQTLNECVARHEAMVNERIGTEQALRTITELLAIPLGLQTPALAAEATRIRRMIVEVAESACKQEGWLAELASVLLHVALSTVPLELSARWRSRGKLTVDERRKIGAAVQQLIVILQPVTKAGAVCDALLSITPTESRDSHWRVSPTAGAVMRLLTLVMRFDAELLQGQSPTAAISTLRRDANAEDLPIVHALAKLRAESCQSGTILSEVQLGQRIVSDVRLSNGVLFLPGGHDVTPATLEKIRGGGAEVQQRLVYAVSAPV
ncbi:MAG: response regulator [Gemmatimonas sp.]